MENNVNINEELLTKPQGMLLAQKISTLEKSLDCLKEFFANYTTDTISKEVNNQVCVFQNIDSNSEQGQQYQELITSFFSLGCEEAKRTIDSMIELLKSKIDTMNEKEYNEELKVLFEDMINKIRNFYLNKMEELNGEIIQTKDINIKEKIQTYISSIIIYKVMKVLEDKCTTYTEVINNNNVENEKKYQDVTEKTIEIVERMNKAT